MSLLVVGSVALDSVETPFDKRERVLGGSASYFSVVSSLITPTRLVGVIGNDFPEYYVDLLKSRGVDLRGLERADGKTFFWAGRYHGNMVDRTTLDTQLNVFQHFDPKVPEAYRDSAYVFLANIDPALQLKVLDQIQHPRFVACDTMNFWLQGSTLPIVKQVVKRCDAVFLSDEEARMLSGQHNLVKAAAEIRLMGAKSVMIKRGDAGAMLFNDEGTFIAPAYPLEHVVDPTGAGDCFAGGFMAFLAHTKDLSLANLRRAVVFGSATASFAVEAFSADRFKDLGRDELLNRCRGFARLVHFEEISL